MAKERFHDFDAAWAERKPLTIKVQGNLHALPASLPLKLVTRLERLRGDKGDEYKPSLDELNELASTLFGREQIDAWIEGGLELDQLGDLFTKTIELYKGEDDSEAEPEGEAPAPETGASDESSSTGQSSRPISLASTG
jgi:hypothetical protein